MKFKRWILWSLLYITLFLFLIGMFYIEMTLYSVLPPEHGGMSYWEKFKYVWYSSVPFYGIVLLFFFSYFI